MEESVLKLPKELTIFTVEIFWRTLVEAIENMYKSDENRLVLYFDYLEKIDGSGVQLLLSLEKTMLKEKLDIRYRDVSEPIKKVLKFVGVGYLLEKEDDLNE